MLKKTYRYRIYPTAKQIKALQASLDSCRWTYNQTLAIRKKSWEEEQKSLSLYDTNKLLVQWKIDKPDLANAFSQCLQNAQLRVDLAFKAFFRRVKAKENPGYPRFRSFDRYDSFTFPQSGFRLVNDRLKLSKIGSVKIRKHRDIEGTVKTLTIRHSATGKWYASFSCKVETNPLREVESVVGIDVGLASFATFSNGNKIENPRFFRTEEKVLAKAQKKLSKQEEGSAKREKAKKVVCRIHERISNKRSDFTHKLSRTLVNTYQIMAFEKLNIKQMRENGFKGIRKSIGDVAWGQFIQFTTYKAACAGRTVIFVDPRNTSRRCSRCGQFVEKTLSDRIHSCSCGLVMDRDENASLNILRVGLDTLAAQTA